MDRKQCPQRQCQHVGEEWSRGFATAVFAVWGKAWLGRGGLYGRGKTGVTRGICTMMGLG